MPTSTLAKRGWFLLFLAISVFYFYGLGSLPLVGPDEPRYAEIAREMLERGDFITPTLGGIPWLEKPPLLYWLIAASYRVFGVNEFAARFGPALCGLVTGALVWWTARAVEKIDAVTNETADSNSRLSDFASWSALVFLSSFGVIAFSRGATFDIVLTMTLTGAMACFFVWHLRTTVDKSLINQRQFLLLGFYSLIGLSMLAKGLVGVVLAFAVVGAYFIVRRERPPGVFLKSLVWGIPVALAVAGIWYVPMIHRHGWGFINQFIVQHHFARFLTNKYHHPQPFYFYVPILALLVLPWTVFLGASLVSLRSLRDNTPLGRMRVFWILLLLGVVGLFSISVSKLPAYVLPAVPAAALLVADRISYYRFKQRGENIIRLSGILFLIAAVAAPWYLFRVNDVPRSYAIAGALACGVAGAFALILPRRRTAAVFLFAACSFTLALMAVVGSGGPAARESVRDLMRLASVRGYGNTAVVGLHTVERTAEFYAAGRLVYGADGEPVKFEGADDVARSAQRAGGVVLCFVPVEYQSQLTNSSKIETEIIGNNGSVSLLVVRSR